MFEKWKRSGARAEKGSASASGKDVDEVYLSPVILSRVDPMAAAFASGVRIRTGLNA